MNEKIISAAKDFAKEFFAADFSGHDYYHTIRVYNLATHIAKQEGGNLLTVQVAALLHDVDDRKLVNAEHEPYSNAIQFLREHSVPEDKITEIIQIISEVSFSKNKNKTPSTLESKIVQDADRLDGTGAMGIARTFSYGGNRNQPIYIPESATTRASAEEYEKFSSQTSIAHFYDKLLLLKDLMNTATAKKIAEHRHKYLEEFLDEFHAEWNGEK